MGIQYGYTRLLQPVQLRADKGNGIIAYRFMICQITGNEQRIHLMFQAGIHCGGQRIPLGLLQTKLQFRPPGKGRVQMKVGNVQKSKTHRYLPYTTQAAAGRLIQYYQ